MSKFDKLIKEIKSSSGDIRFQELKKVLESYGYVGKPPKGGSSSSRHLEKDFYTSLIIQQVNLN